MEKISFLKEFVGSEKYKNCTKEHKEYYDRKLKEEEEERKLSEKLNTTKIGELSIAEFFSFMDMYIEKFNSRGDY